LTSQNHGRIVRCPALAIMALLQGVLAGQTAAPPVPLWPSDNRPPNDLQGKFVFLDQGTSTIVMVIPGSLRGQPDVATEIIRVPFKNQFDPQVSVSLGSAEPDRYRYAYSLANGKTAKDPVKDWSIVASCGDPRSSLDALPIGWHCTRIDNPFAKARQLALPYLLAPPHLPEPGCAVACFLDGQQPPDSMGARLTVVSGLKPGFTTASAGNYPPYQVSQEWPEAVLEQVAKLDAAGWSNKHTVTLGPRFGADFSASNIVADFLQGLSELVRTGRLANDSNFLRQLRTALAQAAQTGGLDPAQIARPSTDLEREIAEAVKLSLTPDGPAR
jgi:hypothetical protein